LYPLSILRDGHRQVYAASNNENVYTDLWKGPFYGFKDVTETYQRTEDPIRVKPLNIYYHFYSGEHLASLRALQRAFHYAAKQSLHKIHTSEYIRMVEDYFATRIRSIDGGFAVTTGGHLRTVRFDDTARTLDRSRCQGVSGAKREKGSLYVFLDAGSDHKIVFTNASEAARR
ncbi:MAG: hypothetical protein AABZ44_05160, partial [Elusimicrobiota bacterium]